MAPKLYNKFALGVSGAIEAANTFNLVLRIKPLCSELFVIFTTKGLAYSSQEAIAAVSGTTVITDNPPSCWINHTSIAETTDFFLLAPASANVIGKLAHGIADNYLTTFSLCVRSPKALAPSMANAMWLNSIVQENIETTKRHGYTIINPVVGREVATLSENFGAMPCCEVLLDEVSRIRRDFATMQFRDEFGQRHIKGEC